ncbi:Alpha/Beta hydrolase protein [Xylariales sp. PMI_506]|nr:Alpha/Beta hydrolase protein [Xylariales sp. PMI_506]
MQWSTLCLAGLAASVATAAPQAKRQTSVTVDLGYEVHSASLNSTGEYYTFSNIPYADQPIGDLRFKETQLPTGTNSTINAGTTNYICMQAYPEWVAAIEAAEVGYDVATVTALLDSQADQTESCLLLDVYVPASIFERGAAAEAPVMVWIHGGGFTYGSKTSSVKAAGLLDQAGDDIIIVAINYRLGMFGWLGGSDVTPNLGLYDQRVAFSWVQKYISLFGGDPEWVTAAGESAGASSVLHQITAYGGAEGGTPFQQAIPMSPAFQFNLNMTAGYDMTMAAASEQTGEDISTVAQLSALSTSQLSSINQAVVYPAAVGMFNFGPVVDGTIVPAYPQVLLAKGEFDNSVMVLASHTSNESVPFTPSTIKTAADVRAYVVSGLPEASNDTINYFLDTVYPDVLDGTYPWKTEFARAVKMSTELFFACSTRYLSLAMGYNTYNMLFAYPPGYHGEDVPYTFFNGDTTTSDDGLPVSPTIAYALQDYLTTFVKAGNPNLNGYIQWPVYGNQGNIMEFTYTGLALGIDDMYNSRCDWIQQAMLSGEI